MAFLVAATTTATALLRVGREICEICRTPYLEAAAAAATTTTRAFYGFRLDAHFRFQETAV